MELFESLKSFRGFGGDGCSNKHLERLADVANSQCTNYSFLKCMTVTDERETLTLTSDTEREHLATEHFYSRTN